MDSHQLAAALASAVDSDTDGHDAGADSEEEPGSGPSDGMPFSLAALAAGPPPNGRPGGAPFLAPGSLGRSASFAAFPRRGILDDSVGEDCMMASPHIPDVLLFAQASESRSAVPRDGHAGATRNRAHSLHPSGSARTVSSEADTTRTGDAANGRGLHLSRTPPRAAHRAFPGAARALSSRADSLVSVDASTASCRADSTCSEISDVPAPSDRLRRFDRNDSLVSVDSCPHGVLSPTASTQPGPQPFRTPRLRRVAAASAGLLPGQRPRVQHGGGGKLTESAPTSTAGVASSRAGGRSGNGTPLVVGESVGLVWSERLHVAKYVSRSPSAYLTRAVGFSSQQSRLPSFSLARVVLLLIFSLVGLLFVCLLFVFCLMDGWQRACQLAAHPLPCEGHACRGREYYVYGPS